MFKSILGRTRKPDIVFSRDGRIDISAQLSQTMELQRGDVIDILEDGSSYYLYKRCSATPGSRHEAMVYPTNRNGNHMRTWSRRLCSAILGATESEAWSLRLACGDAVAVDNKNIIPIFTKNPL